MKYHTYTTGMCYTVHMVTLTLWSSTSAIFLQISFWTGATLSLRSAQRPLWKRMSSSRLGNNCSACWAVRMFCFWSGILYICRIEDGIYDLFVMEQRQGVRGKGERGGGKRSERDSEKNKRQCLHISWSWVFASVFFLYTQVLWCFPVTLLHTASCLGVIHVLLWVPMEYVLTQSHHLPVPMRHLNNSMMNYVT